MARGRPRVLRYHLNERGDPVIDCSPSGFWIWYLDKDTTPNRGFPIYGQVVHCIKERGVISFPDLPSGTKVEKMTIETTNDEGGK
jgi:hypothetical protein